ncbi:hypothetical protein MHYP_G00047430 [Metynnis hypsauchen]
MFTIPPSPTCYHPEVLVYKREAAELRATVKWSCCDLVKQRIFQLRSPASCFCSLESPLTLLFPLEVVQLQPQLRPTGPPEPTRRGDRPDTQQTFLTGSSSIIHSTKHQGQSN